MTQAEPSAEQNHQDEPLENSEGDNVQHKPKKGKKLLMGIVLFVVGFVLFAVSFLFSAGEEVISIDSSKSLPENDGKLVHVVGEIQTENFKDPMFQIEANGVMLERVVEMYQWVESAGNYSKKWSSELVVVSSDDAREKGYINPPEMPFFSEKWQVETVKLDGFVLSADLVDKIISHEPIKLTQKHFDKLNEHGKKAFKLHDGKYFFGVKPDSPRVGDLLVSFKKFGGGKATVLAQQQGNEFEPYRSENGVIEKISLGNRDLKSIASGLDLGGSSVLFWALRGSGILLVLFSLFVIFSGVFGARRAAKEQSVVFDDHPDENQEQKHEEVADVLEDESDHAESQIDDNYEPEEELQEDAEHNVKDSEPHPEEVPTYQDNINADSVEDVAEDIATSPLMDEVVEEDAEMPEGIEMIGPDSAYTEPDESGEQKQAEELQEKGVDFAPEEDTSPAPAEESDFVPETDEEYTPAEPMEFATDDNSEEAAEPEVAEEVEADSAAGLDFTNDDEYEQPATVEEEDEVSDFVPPAPMEFEAEGEDNENQEESAPAEQEDEEEPVEDFVPPSPMEFEPDSQKEETAPDDIEEAEEFSAEETDEVVEADDITVQEETEESPAEEEAEPEEAEEPATQEEPKEEEPKDDKDDEAIDYGTSFIPPSPTEFAASSGGDSDEFTPLPEPGANKKEAGVPDLPPPPAIGGQKPAKKNNKPKKKEDKAADVVEKEISDPFDNEEDFDTVDDDEFSPFDDDK